MVFILSFLLGVSLMGNWLQFVYQKSYKEHIKKTIDELINERIVVKIKQAVGDK
jgi:hypothetical protein